MQPKLTIDYMISCCQHDGASAAFLEGLSAFPGEGRRVAACLRSFARRHGVNVQPAERYELDAVYDLILWCSGGGTWSDRAWEVAVLVRDDEVHGVYVSSNEEHAYTLLGRRQWCQFGVGVPVMQLLTERLIRDADLRGCIEHPEDAVELFDGYPELQSPESSELLRSELARLTERAPLPQDISAALMAVISEDTDEPTHL